MPAEYRFSNNEKLAILPMWVIDRIKEEMRLGPAAWQAITDAVEQADVPQALPCEVRLPPGTVIGQGVPVSTLMLAIAQRRGYPDHARAFSDQHQGEPVALLRKIVDAPSENDMLKAVDEAEAFLRTTQRSMEETGRSDLVHRGPPAATTESLVHYGQPAAVMPASAAPSAPKCETCKGHGVIGWRRGQTAESYEEGESPCEDCNATGYAHSNGMPVSGVCTTCNGLGTVPDGEISGLDGVEFENGPVECVKDCPDCGSGPDELTDLSTWKRRAIEAESKLRTYDPQVVELGEKAMQALLGEPKPSELVLTKCKLCDQLQADLTSRDQRLDQLQQVLLKLQQNLGGTLEQHGFREEVEALLWPDLHSRPEERGTPETEPCSGCGTPGWTGACNKCVPY